MTPKQITFVSKRRELRLVDVPETIEIDSQGRQRRKPGVAYQFNRGQFVTNDPKLIKWLRAHRLYNDGIDGFIETATPAPDPSETLAAISGAAVELDGDEIARILAEEQEGWERPEVLISAQSALDRIAERQNGHGP